MQNIIQDGNRELHLLIFANPLLVPYILYHSIHHNTLPTAEQWPVIPANVVNTRSARFTRRWVGRDDSQFPLHQSHISSGSGTLEGMIDLAGGDYSSVRQDGLLDELVMPEA